MDDEALIGLFFARDERAISALDLQYGALCRTLSRRILKRKEDAEECVWDAYLGVWNAVPPARPNPLRAFVCRIVRNVSMHRYWYLEADKRSAGCTVPLEELSKSLSGEDTAESLFDARELAALLSEFLDSLNRENRVIFLRRYWFCDTGAEIAARTGLSEAAVRVRLTRLRKKLQKLLTENGVTV